MPGITLCYGDVERFRETCEKRRIELEGHAFHHTFELIEPMPDVAIFIHEHNGHPVSRLEDENRLVLWENPAREIDPATILPDKTAEQLQHELNTGFTCTIIDKRERSLHFFNDRLARFPLYYYRDDATFILSRDIALLQDCLPELEMDSVLMAQMLFVGFVPGKPSVYREIESCLPQTSGRLRFERPVRLTIHDKPELRIPPVLENVNRGQHLQEMLHAFIRATKRCAGSSEVTLGLSGGLDSRAVGGALHKLGMTFASATYLDHDRTAARDVRVAKQLARLWDCPFTIYRLAEESEASRAELFGLKRGVNYLGLGFLCDFLRGLNRDSGYVFFTGDGGDKVMPDLYPTEHLADETQFVNYLSRSASIFSIDAIASMLGIDAKAITDYLLDVVSRYPVESWDERYRYFYLAERGGRWLFEGEDRNRYYARTETPFYDWEFYSLAMQAPRDWKRDLQLYRKFLHALSPELTAIASANTMLDITGHDTNPLHYLNWFTFRLTRKLKSMRIRRGHGYLEDRPELVTRIDNLLQRGRISPLSPDYLKSLKRVQAYYLYTILAMIDNGTR